MKNRVLAAIIDGFLFVVLYMSLMPYLLPYLIRDGDVFAGLYYFPFIVVFIYYFLIDFIFLTSPGKWLYNLKITTLSYQKPRRELILLRSLIKTLVMVTVIGPLLMIISLLNNHEALYDTALGLTISSTI